MYRYLLIITMFLLASCSTEQEGSSTETKKDNFDRSVMLQDWADGIIIPGYEVYLEKLDALRQSFETFSDNRNTETLRHLRTAWESAYIQWQHVAMFEIGKAEEIQLRGYTNTYPCNVAELLESIQANVNLELPSTRDAQGFPALDYLINGLAVSDELIMAEMHANPVYIEHMGRLISRLQSLASLVYDDWTDSYRDIFVENVASSATGSVDKLVNDYVYYYEKHLRAGKIGIPAGVFSGTPEEQTVEAIYSNKLSKTLAIEALSAFQNFFNGKPVSDGYEGVSLAAYLDYLNTIKTGADLSALINAQFDNARNALHELNDNFVEQIETDNIEMLEAYDQLQLNVVLLKVDMMQALNVRVDYVDADGD